MTAAIQRLRKSGSRSGANADDPMRCTVGFGKFASITPIADFMQACTASLDSIRGGHHASGKRPLMAAPSADGIDDQAAEQNDSGVTDLLKEGWTFEQDKSETKNRKQRRHGIKPHAKRTRRLRM